MGAIESMLFPDLVQGQVLSLIDSNHQQKENIKKRRILVHPDRSEKTFNHVVITEVPLGVCHYKSGNFEPISNQNIPEDVYSLVQDSMVGCSTSVLVLYKEKVLLGQRTSYPQMTWWFPVSGRINPGVMPQENCLRLCKEKLGLRVDDLSRFEFVGTYSYTWGKREVSLVTRNKHEISVVYAINLESDELPKDFADEDYNDMKWTSMDDFELGNYHPGLLRACQDYHVVKDLTTLVTDLASKKEIDDSVIGKRFKSWCSKRIQHTSTEIQMNKQHTSTEIQMNKQGENSMKSVGNPKVTVSTEDLDADNLEKTKDEAGKEQQLDNLKVKELKNENQEETNDALVKAQEVETVDVGTNDALVEAHEAETVDVGEGGKNMQLSADNKMEKQEVEQEAQDLDVSAEV